MAKPIYVVGANGAHLKLNNSNVVAIRPVAMGEDYSMCLTDSGKFVRLKGSRIGGIGVEKHVTGLGFTKADATHPMAIELAGKIAARDGIVIVEKASQEQSIALQNEFGGKRVHYVPFDPTEKIVTADLTPATNSFCVAMGMASGVSAGVVKVQYKSGAEHQHDIALCDGWLAPLDKDPSQLPRLSGRGGLVEEAAFFIANAGLARVSGPMHVQDNPADDPFPGGSLRLDMKGLPDYIVVGIDADDDLIVRYVRGDCGVVHDLRGIEANDVSNKRLGDYVGAIAAVIVMERAIREAPAPRMKKMAA